MKKNFLMRRRFLTVVAGLAVLVIVMGSVWVWWFERNARAPIRLAMKAARESAQVQQVLGTPMKAGQFARGSLVASDGNGNADLVVQIEGPHGRGTLTEWAQKSEGRWRVCSLDFRSRDGATQVTLVDGATTHCEHE